MIDLPELTKMYYSIGEVAKMFDANVSQIRFWSDKFPQIKPKTKKNGTRLYTPKDIETLKQIHFLVKVEGRSLDGTIKALRKKEGIVKEGNENSSHEVIQKLEMIKKQLQFLREVR